MTMLSRAGAIAFALLCASAAFAQTVQLPQVKNANGSSVPAQATVNIDSSGVEKGTTSNPVVIGGTLSNVVQATATDRSALVGTTAVTLMAANPARKGWSMQVQSTTASCYTNGSAAATADYHSLQVGPGGYFEPDHHVGTGAISIICTGASTPVYAREW